LSIFEYISNKILKVYWAYYQFKYTRPEFLNKTWVPSTSKTHTQAELYSGFCYSDANPSQGRFLSFVEPKVVDIKPFFNFLLCLCTKIHSTKTQASRFRNIYWIKMDYQFLELSKTQNFIFFIVYIVEYLSFLWN